MNNEVWKDVKGYEGLYAISTEGRLKSFHKTPKIIRATLDNYTIFNLVDFLLLLFLANSVPGFIFKALQPSDKQS